MTVIAAAVRHLIAAGVGGEDLVRAIEDMEAARTAPAADTRTPAARRQADYRRRAKATEELSDVTGDITRDVTDVTLRNGHNALRADEGSPQEKKQSQPPSQSPPKGSPLSHDAALAIWNEMADRTGLARALSATGKRQAMLRQRIAEHGEEGFRAAVAAVEQSEFCQGKNERGWYADIGFLLRPDNFVKLIEGGYSAREKPKPPKRPPNAQELRCMIAYAEDHGDPERAEDLKRQLREMVSADQKVSAVVAQTGRSLAVSREKREVPNASW